MRVHAHRVVLGLFYLALLGAAARFAWNGLDYYVTPLAERPRHPEYWTFKPGGQAGHAFGVAGAAMMVLMLGYSLRKRLAVLRRCGAPAIWLDYHILLGICGPLFVVLHSSFKVRGLVALSFWSMVAVALSGVAGRFLYRLIPRTREGLELSLAEVEAQDAELSTRLRDEFGLEAESVRELERIVEAEAGRERTLAAGLVRLPLDAVSLRLRLRRFLLRQPARGGPAGRRFAELVLRKAQLHRRLAIWARLHRLFHYWHVVHKPFAIVMYLFMVVHVIVAWLTGYGWPAR